MRHTRTLLLSTGVIIAYCLIAALSDWGTTGGNVSRAILLAVLAFVWLTAMGPNRRFFS
jgi:hypothetical protein